MLRKHLLAFAVSMLLATVIGWLITGFTVDILVVYVLAVFTWYPIIVFFLTDDSVTKDNKETLAINEVVSEDQLLIEEQELLLQIEARNAALPELSIIFDEKVAQQLVSELVSKDEARLLEVRSRLASKKQGQNKIQQLTPPKEENVRKPESACEYGSWEWAVFLANLEKKDSPTKTERHDPHWWYDSDVARKRRTGYIRPY